MASAVERQRPQPKTSRRLNHLSRGPEWVVSVHDRVQEGDHFPQADFLLLTVC
jgi:hypothetical protein